MSKFKLNSDYAESNVNRKKHSTKRHYDEEDMTDFAYLSRGAAKNYLRSTYGF
jgi:hypothetical protein